MEAFMIWLKLVLMVAPIVFAGVFVLLGLMKLMELPSTESKPEEMSGAKRALRQLSAELGTGPIEYKYKYF